MLTPAHSMPSLASAESHDEALPSVNHRWVTTDPWHDPVDGLRQGVPIPMIIEKYGYPNPRDRALLSQMLSRAARQRASPEQLHYAEEALRSGSPWRTVMEDHGIGHPRDVGLMKAILEDVLSHGGFQIKFEVLQAANDAVRLRGWPPDAAARSYGITRPGDLAILQRTHERCRWASDMSQAPQNPSVAPFGLRGSE